MAEYFGHEAGFSLQTCGVFASPEAAASLERMWTGFARGTAACAVSAVMGMIACGGSTTVVDVTEYDQACQADEDCVVVQDGDICCGCPNAAINVGDHERYPDDLGSCSEQCDIGCTGELQAYCNRGTCDVRPSGPTCEPGLEVFCKCQNGADGTKACNADGVTFGDCVCG